MSTAKLQISNNDLDLISIYTELVMNGEQMEGQIRFISSQFRLLNGFSLIWLNTLSQGALKVFYNILKREENGNQKNIAYVLEKIM